VVSALKADPKTTSELQQLVSPAHAMSSPGYFRDIQNRLKKFVESGQLGPFMNGYWGSEAYVLPAEANLMAVTHYLEALDRQKDWVKVHTIIGGKNPHPNFMVGGMPCAINLDRDGAAGAPINMDRLNFIKSRIDEMNEFPWIGCGTRRTRASLHGGREMVHLVSKNEIEATVNEQSATGCACQVMGAAKSGAISSHGESISRQARQSIVGGPDDRGHRVGLRLCSCDAQRGAFQLRRTAVVDPWALARAHRSPFCAYNLDS
jgi:hypothetical protein